MDGCVTYSGQGKVAGTAIAAVAAEVAALALGWKGRGWEAAPAQAASLGAFWGEACPWAEIQSRRARATARAAPSQLLQLSRRPKAKCPLLGLLSVDSWSSLASWAGCWRRYPEWDCGHEAPEAISVAFPTACRPGADVGAWAGVSAAGFQHWAELSKVAIPCCCCLSEALGMGRQGGGVQSVEVTSVAEATWGAQPADVQAEGLALTAEAIGRRLDGERGTWSSDGTGSL